MQLVRGILNLVPAFGPDLMQRGADGLRSGDLLQVKYLQGNYFGP